MLRQTHPCATLPAMLLMAVMLLAVPVVNAAPPQDCPGNHPKRARRIVLAIGNGDVHVARKIAQHVVRYAVVHYAISDLISDADIQRSRSDMYTFLKWKLGAPTPVAAQWVTAGYGHFDKAYVDEAAAILLGVVSFKDKEPELKLPPWMLEYIEMQAGNASDAIAGWLVEQGVPPLVAKVIGEEAEDVLIGGLERNVAFYIPKSYDIDDRLVLEAIAAKREAADEVDERTVESQRILELELRVAELEDLLRDAIEDEGGME